MSRFRGPPFAVSTHLPAHVLSLCEEIVNMTSRNQSVEPPPSHSLEEILRITSANKAKRTKRDIAPPSMPALEVTPPPKRSWNFRMRPSWNHPRPRKPSKYLQMRTQIGDGGGS